MSTRKKAVSGIIWTFSESLINKGFGFVTAVVLGNILSINDFGLIAMISLFVQVGNTIVESGFGNSLIRTKDADDGDYSSVFWMNLGLGVIMYLLLYVASPWIASYFDQPILSSLIRWYCLAFIISAFSTVQLSILSSQLQFRSITLISIPSAILGPLIAILMAYFGFGVWSLVALYLVSQIVQSLGLWYVSKWRPSFIFKKEKAKTHFFFGYKLLLSALLDTAFKNIYNFIIGKRYTVDALGYFDRGRAVNEYPTSILTNIVSKVTYPLLSNIQDNKTETSNAYKQIIRTSLFINAPMMLALAAMAPLIFELFWKEKWLPAVPYFQIVCLASMLYPIHSVNLNILKVYSRTNLFLRLEIIKKILMALCIAIAWNFGILGLAWSIVASSFLALLVNTYYSKELIGYSTKQQLVEMLPTLLISGAMYLVMKQVISLLEGNVLILQILISFIAGFIFYFGICWIIKSKQLLFIIKTIKSYSS
ncbi:lipopolysaccharide biosynthesis protein [Sphingobacterium chuzhouense]|uniref:Lipopolysaccharide biosynthesis protein n=1 Tax=Sphingobacterium chuzhouense TaxID=1742264 RepID=A0ABR7XNN4_9SPHI|nr:lipopolysaccharide biosynthesis protein [Sphingobacterium chuzhouense]MBD1420789.1 lipopolysaccharide biosynthesis protein [Sphingobacterium chuzhouense]